MAPNGLICSFIHTLSHTHSLALTHTHSFSHSFTYSQTHSYTHILTHSLTLVGLGDRKGIRLVKETGCWLVCWWWWFDWSCARLTAPVVQFPVMTTTSIILYNTKHRLTQVHLENGPLKHRERARVRPWTILNLNFFDQLIDFFVGVEWSGLHVCLAPVEPTIGLDQLLQLHSTNIITTCSVRSGALKVFKDFLSFH